MCTRGTLQRSSQPLATLGQQHIGCTLPRGVTTETPTPGVAVTNVAALTLPDTLYDAHEPPEE